MGPFDLLFIVAFLTTIATLLTAIVLAIRRQRRRALVLLLRWCVCAAVYLSAVVLASVFWPRTVLQVGDDRCFDDWCIGVDSATRQASSYVVNLRLSSRARRVSQRENGVVVYLVDRDGRRYDPVPDDSAVRLNVLLEPGQSLTARRIFSVPGEARELGLVITHQGGFPIGWFIIGDETWFHKPTLVRLP
jgi:hypothetical protein